MEILSLGFFSALITIIMIDLVLAGDNAVVIAMAARNLPKEHQRKVILLGMAGAIVIRGAATLIVVKLLQIPWLLLIGGVVLIWIAYKLLIEDEQKHEIQAKNKVGAAIGTIILADATMGLDNVLAVAGAAHGHYLLVILGLLISIPIIIWGSTLFIRWIERFPPIIYVGAGILAFTAGKMITDEQQLSSLFGSYPLLKWGTIALIVLLVVVAGRLTQMRRQRLVADARKNNTAAKAKGTSADM